MKWQAAQGTTLLELMLSLTLSLILMALLVALYYLLEVQSERQVALFNLQQNTYFILQKLQKEIKLAGFIGCPLLTADFLMGNSTTYHFNANNAITLAQNSASSTILTVRHRGLQHALLQAPTQGSILMVSADLSIKVGDILLIADCRHADIFQVAKIQQQQQQQRITPLFPLCFSYAAGAELGQLEVNTYFVEKTQRVDAQGKPIYAWYYRDRQGQQFAWVEGIEQMQIVRYPASAQTQKPAFKVNLSLVQSYLHKRAYAFIS